MSKKVCMMFYNLYNLYTHKFNIDIIFIDILLIFNINIIHVPLIREKYMHIK